jgi:hypothetical protein
MNWERQRHLKVGLRKRKFTENEDSLILKDVAEKGVHAWTEIAQKLPERTARQCRERWKHYLAPEVESSRSWTPHEDAILEAKCREFGPKWSRIRDFLPGRTDVNIKNRSALLIRRLQKRAKDPVRFIPPQGPRMSPAVLPIVNLGNSLFVMPEIASDSKVIEGLCSVIRDIDDYPCVQLFSMEEVNDFSGNARDMVENEEF